MNAQGITTLSEAIEKVYDLHVGVSGQGAARHERPHKPVLILTVLDLIANGEARPDLVVWSENVRARFRLYFEVVKSANDQTTPENPFYHLRRDGIWEPSEVIAGKLIPLRAPPQVGAFDRVQARFVGGFERFVVNAIDRMHLREAIVSRYFPAKRAAVAALFDEAGVPGIGMAAEAREAEEKGYGRDAAFRRKILSIYDYQCTACGLRIKLPDADITFVDAAHIIPFSEQPNDHPTNGLALCKNHHWAMDRNLIAPSPEGVWRVSKRLIAHRSPGEAALLELRDSPILPPTDDAFTPDPEALRIRCARLA